MCLDISSMYPWHPACWALPHAGCPLVGLRGGRGPWVTKKLTITMLSSLSNPSVPAASGSVAAPSLRNVMKRKKDGSSSDSQEDDDGASPSNTTLNLTTNWPRFWIVASKQGSPDVTSVSPFVIDKTLQGCIGTAKTIKKLRSGVLLIEVSREAQAVSLQRLTMIASIPITVTPHRSMKVCALGLDCQSSTSGSSAVGSI